MRKFDDFFNEQMKDTAFKEEYEKLQPEFDLIRAEAKEQATEKPAKCD